MIALASHTALWVLATGRLLAGIPPFTDAAALSGWRLDFGPEVRAGWPSFAGVQIQGVRATRTLGGTALRWTAERVVLSLTASAPDTLKISIEGEQTAAIGEGLAIPIHAARALLQVPLSGTGPMPFEARDVVVGGATGRKLAAGLLTGEVAPLSASVTASDVLLSPALPAPFDGALAASVGIVANQPFPEATSPGGSASAWHAGGGRIDVPAMELRWGPLHVTGSGGGGLDQQLQPAAQATIRATGAGAALDAAGRGGLLVAGPVAAARAVIGLLAMGSRDGGVTLPIGLADRTLTVARFPLVKLPALDWDLR